MTIKILRASENDLRKQVRELEQRLQKYGDHLPSCRSLNQTRSRIDWSPGSCSCGWVQSEPKQVQADVVRKLNKGGSNAD